MMNDTERALWLASRCSKLTASRMRDAMDFLKNGNPTAARSNLLRELLAERVTGMTMRHFVNPAMEWGLLQEPEAKNFYQAMSGNLITECGFYDHPEIENFGATPDGLLSANGLIEIKCPTTGTFLNWWLAGKVTPDEHKPQMIAQLLCTGRQWCDFVAFDPRIQSESHRMFISRFEPTDEERAKVLAAAVTFLDELDEMFYQFTHKREA
jgi:putative phage-type endonuclease